MITKPMPRVSTSVVVAALAAAAALAAQLAWMGTAPPAPSTALRAGRFDAPDAAARYALARRAPLSANVNAADA